MMASSSTGLPGSSHDAHEWEHVDEYESNQTMAAEASSSQEHRVPSYPPSSSDWEAYRSIITQFYVAENKRLTEVIKLMKDNYGFRATARMYKQRISDWNLKKNYNASQMEKIANYVQYYVQQDQKLPRLLMNGEPVDLSRVRRYYRDHCLDNALRDSVMAKIDQVLSPAGGIDPDHSIEISNVSYYPDPVLAGSNRVHEVLCCANDYSNWCITLDDSTFNESYEELVHVPLEKDYVRKPEPGKNVNSQMVWSLFQDGLKYLESSQTPLAFTNFNHGCHLVEANLREKPNFVLRLVVREFGTPSWQAYSEVRKILLAYILQMALTVMGEKHPLALALQQFLQPDTFEGSQELVLKVLLNSCKRGLGSGHKEVFRLMRGLSVVQKRQGDIQLSKQTLKNAARESEDLRGLKDDQTRRILSRLANQYTDEGRYEESERLYEHVLRGADLIHNGLDDITSCTFQNLANVAKKQGDTEKQRFWLAQEDRVRELIPRGEPPFSPLPDTPTGFAIRTNDAEIMEDVYSFLQPSSDESSEIVLTPPSSKSPSSLSRENSGQRSSPSTAPIASGDVSSGDNGSRREELSSGEDIPELLQRDGSSPAGQIPTVASFTSSDDGYRS